MADQSNRSLLLPSPAQLALALVILKSKPVNLTVEAYVNELRQHVSRNRSTTIDQARQHLDSAMYWKQAYEKSEATQASLLDRIYELEQRQSNKLNAPFLPDDRTERSTEMERADETTHTKANSRSKRKAVPAKQIENSGKVLDQNLGLGFALNRDETVPTSFLRSIFNLRQLLVASSSEVPMICTGLRIVCRSAGATIKEGFNVLSSQPSKNNCANRESTATRAKDVCQAIRNSFATLLQALNRINTKELSNAEVRSAVAEIVFLFQTVLGQLHAILLRDTIMKHEEEQRKAKIPKSRTKATVAVTQVIDQVRQQICQHLAKLLVDMLIRLDLRNTAQGQLWEGLLCAFLDHLGSSLSLIVFADSGIAPGKKPTLGLMPPQGLQDAVDVDQEVALQTTRLEAPYLVFVLKRIMIFQASQIEQSKILHSLIGTRPQDASQNDCSQKLKGKIQHTLMRGVFGDDDKSFQYAFQRADNVEDSEVDDPPDWIGQEEGMSEWFVGEVWAHLGWEIMTKGTEVDE